jgi:phosphoglucosamine mutase
VIATGDRPDGKNINEGVGSLHPERMIQLVKEHGAFCGIAYDGDADRVIMCDEKGKLIDGDSITAALAFDFKRKGVLSGDIVVGTVMSNLGLEKALKQQGIGLVRADVGDRYVLQEMLARGATLGGEQSGHIISLEHNTTGDGILSSLLMLALAQSAGHPMSHYSSLVTRYPQEIVGVKVKERVPLAEIKGAADLISGAEKALGDCGRLLVRYSGTELKLRIMAECEDAKLCAKVVNDLQKSFGDLLN